MLRHIFFSSFLVLFLLLPRHGLRAQESSVLANGEWYKLAISKTAVYQLSGSFLQERGIDLSAVNIDNLGIFGYGGGMLPQALSDPRFSDLPENHILITGTDDGRFDPEDQIIFFAQGPDKVQFLAESEETFGVQYQKNLYADTAYYFLSLSEGQGLRVQNQTSVDLPATPVNSFDDFWVHELDEYNILKPGSGREWYGENFYSGDQITLSAQTSGLVSGEKLQLKVEALGRTTSSSELEVNLNQLSLGELPLLPILGGTYTDKGKESSVIFEASTNGLGSAENLDISLRYRAADGRGRAHLNRLVMQFPRFLRLYGSQTSFRSVQSVEQAASSFIVKTDLQESLIWEVSHPLKPRNQEAEYKSDGWQFVTETFGLLREFVIFDPSALPEPVWQDQVVDHSLPTTDVPELLIIVPASLRPAAERLAALRREHDQLQVAVAETEDIYRQYASGRQDISAIRNYVKDFYDAEPAKLKYLLLFGKASYDYKDRLENNTNLVPTYQSRNSIHPIYSFPSDDFYAFLEDDEGFWEETFRGDHTLDIGVGRLPVKNIQEAEQVVDKLIHYAKSPNSLGDWRTRVTFLADDGDNDRYQKDSELLSANVKEKISGVNTSKIYLDAYEQERFPNQELAPDVNEAIEESIERGSLIFNFVGHGNEQRLADENVLNVGMISRWQNLDRLPFFVTATCEFGRHDDPERISGAERLVLNPQGGAVGMVTTARPVFSNTNYLLNRSFYEHVFSRENGNFLRIGDIFKKTKNGALNGRDNRNFSLLADPSLRLSYPEHRIVIDSIRTLNGRESADTLRAFQEVRVFGRINDPMHETTLESFEGELTLALHDKPRLIQTRGNEGTQMQFQQTNNVINRVRASVNQGMFSVDIVVPQNINYQTEQGRISLYALSEQTSRTDAFGGLDSLFVGGSLDGLTKDNQPPRIRLFVNDTTFRSGGLSNNEPVLIALLEDDQGINLSRQQVGQEISAQLTSAESGEILRSMVLNDFYETELDDYQKGRIEYPMGNLEEGKYILTLQAWDSHNNRSEVTSEFVVSNQGYLQIRNFNNYPNPFNQSTTFVIEHNRAGDDLLVSLNLFDILGNQVLSFEEEFISVPGRLRFLEWKVQNQVSGKLAPGIYLANLRLKSISDNQEAFTNLRIILTN